MALINNLYVHASKESVEREVETVSHPTESGFPISDSIRKKPVVISVSGKIVDTDTMTASEILQKLINLQNGGSLVKYIGQAGTFSNLQIQGLPTDYDNKTYGGSDFSITLQEIKIAKSAYVKPKKVQTTKKKSQLAVGDTVRFLGGSVYVSSDAKKAAAKRHAGTCKLTKISTLNGATHIYHLISTDGGRVYGWVDASKVQGATTQTAYSTNGGTQQIQKGNGTAVYHFVKKGDTVYNLVNVKYREFAGSVKWVIEHNPKAFSRKGDPKTLKIGAVLLMGYENQAGLINK